MNIEKIINTETIFLKQDFNTAEEVIKFAGDVFIKQGCCNNEYKKAMLNVLEKFKGIIVLDDGIAMPHARPEEGALKDRLLIMTLNKPIDFYNDDFEKVDTVIAVCSTGSDRHIELIQLVGLLIENKIREQNFNSKEDILDFVYKTKEIGGL